MNKIKLTNKFIAKPRVTFITIMLSSYIILQFLNSDLFIKLIKTSSLLFAIRIQFGYSFPSLTFVKCSFERRPIGFATAPKQKLKDQASCCTNS